MSATVLVPAIGLGACGGGGDGGSGAAARAERKAAGDDLTACLANRLEIALEPGSQAAC